MTKPPPEAALAALAPDGILSAPQAVTALTVRCACRQVLLRVLRTPAGLLAVWRSHLPPVDAQLRAKGSGWSGGDQQDARIVHEGNLTRVESELAFAVGWHSNPLWLAQASTEGDGLELEWSGLARCRCGLSLNGRRLAPHAERHLASRRGPELEAPRDALRAPAEAQADVLGQHAEMVRDHLRQREEW